jgi:arylsulfatase
MMGVFVYRQESEVALPTAAGKLNVRLEFAADGAAPGTGGEVSLIVDGERVGGGRMDHTVPFRFSGYSGMDVGRDNGLPVDRSYVDRSPFPFTGTIRKVVFDLDPHPSEEHARVMHEHAQHAALAHGMGA